MRIIFPDCHRTQMVCCYMEYISFQVIDAGHFWAQKPESESARGLQMLQDRINNNEGRNLRVRRMINLLSVCKADAVFFFFRYIAFWFMTYVTLTTVSIISVTLLVSRHSGLIESHGHAICQHQISHVQILVSSKFLLLPLCGSNCKVRPFLFPLNNQLKVSLNFTL